jgi:hypothetical protein
MVTKVLKILPTLIVAGITGWAAWPVLNGDGAPPAPAAPATTKPPARPQASSPGAATTKRSPFVVDLSQEEIAAELEDEEVVEAPPVVAAPPPVEDTLVAGMKLSGTYIDKRDKLAIIDGRIYARGERIRGPDGAVLPYEVAEVRAYQAVLRHGTKSVLLSLTTKPTPVAAREPVSIKAELDLAKLGAGPPAGPRPTAVVPSNSRSLAASKGSTKSAPPGNPGSSGDPANPVAAALIKQLESLGGDGQFLRQMISDPDMLGRAISELSGNSGPGGAP